MKLGAFYVMLFPALIRCTLQWADYDNDGDLDFALAGTTYSGTPVSDLYQNNEGTNQYSINAPASVPTGLLADVQGNSVTLAWDKSVDDNTPQDGLSYNLRIGTSNQGDEILPAMSLGDGFRKISHIGNTCQMNSWHIDNLMPGTYFWSVQAIDQAYLGSEFAPELSFTITATNIADMEPGDGDYIIYPNPASQFIHFSDDLVTEGTQIEIFDTSGKSHLKASNSLYDQRIDISFLPKGLYIARITGNKKTTSIKLVIR